MMRTPFRLVVLVAALAATGCQDAAKTGPAAEPTVVPVVADVDALAVPADEVEDALPAVPGEELPAFTTQASSAEVSSFGEEVPILRAVRIGRHDSFDRLVFEFDSEGVPQWHIAYVEGPAADCGSGHDVPLDGEARLQVRFMGAHAHTEAGQPTSGPRRRAVGQPALRELVRTCDFEAEVTWFAGVAGRQPYRPRVLDDPSRLVIDIAH